MCTRRQKEEMGELRLIGKIWKAKLKWRRKLCLCMCGWWLQRGIFILKGVSKEDGEIAGGGWKVFDVQSYVTRIAIGCSRSFLQRFLSTCLTLSSRLRSVNASTTSADCISKHLLCYEKLLCGMNETGISFQRFTNEKFRWSITIFSTILLEDNAPWQWWRCVMMRVGASSLRITKIYSARSNENEKIVIRVRRISKFHPPFVLFFYYYFSVCVFYPYLNGFSPSSACRLFFPWGGRWKVWGL